MKLLYLLRHAKAERQHAEDHSRPLHTKGIEACEQLMHYFEEGQQVPEVILCSSAVRTLQTAEYFREHGWSSVPLTTSQRLYLAPPGEMLSVIQEQPNRIESLMLVGHNPGIHQLALALSGAGERQTLLRLVEHFPTAALAVLQCDIPSWDKLSPGKATLASLFIPTKSTLD